MPGCQSYALIARSRGPLLLSLSQQTMNWEWKSVGKQGKDVKAPLWAWKKPLTELSFIIITLEEWRLLSYTQRFRFLWSTGKKWSFLPKDKSPGHFWNEKEREREKGQSWNGEERESLRQPGSPLQPTAEGHWSLLGSWRQLLARLSKALEQVKQAKGFCSLCPLQSPPTPCSML